jgi:predicted dehydrogenase
MSPRFRSLYADIAAGRLGDIFYVEADYNNGRLYKLAEGWRGRIKDYSVMLGGGIHMIDLVLWLTGQRVVEVSAMGGSFNSRQIGIEPNDLSVALLRLRNGALAKVAANFGCVEPHFHRLTVYGTAATFENARGDALLWENRDPASPARAIDTAYPGVDKGDMIPAFMDAIAGRGKAEVDEDEAFAALSVAFAIDQAQRTRSPVMVDYV